MFKKRFSTAAVSYAGPLLAPETRGETPSLPKRIKKREGCSEDDGPAIIGDEEIKNEDYRCGGPNLVRLPAVNQHIMSQSDPLRLAYYAELKGPIEGILEKWNVHYQTGSPLRRAHDTGGSIDWADTILVGAWKRQLDSSWLKACKEILQLFIQKGKTNLQIEIIDERALQCMISRPVPSTDPFVPVWQDLRGQVLDILGNSEWTMLSAHLRGLFGGTFVHTIIICVREDSMQNWSGVRDAVVELLDDKSLSYVAVEILRDTMLQFAEDTILNERDWNIKARLGGSLGLRGADQFSSTFGGFLELQSSSGEWKKYGVTNYHSVTPGRSDDEWEKHGIRPGDAKNDLSIDHPSISDRRMSVTHYEQMASEVQTQEYFQMEQRIDEEDPSVSRTEKDCFEYDRNRLNEYIRTIELAHHFQGNQHLGNVYAASGYRLTESNNLLDWALIDVTSDRISENEIPRAKDVPGSRKRAYNANSGVLDTTADLGSNMTVCKAGRSTGFTEGRLGALQYTDLQIWFKGKDEWRKVKGLLREIFPVAPRVFADAGDSGSFVMDRHGAFVGLYVGGATSTGTGLFLEAKDLFNDIKAITGAKDVRIPCPGQ
ncbi:hypothetical protein FQN49_003295 [Arthroderma sp. PD_2]|nr:hypothetical protein FQN49_003295 [Arthroderma sp. PD_2]